jgi:putative membrane protein
MEERIAGLMNYVFTAPHWKNTIPVTLVFSIIVGLGVFDFGWKENLVAGFVLIGLPALISSVLTYPLVRVFRGHMTINQSSLLAFIGTIIISSFCAIAALLSFLTGWQITISAYVMSLGAIFAFRLLIMMAIASRNIFKIIIPASLQTLFGALFLPFFNVNGFVLNLIGISIVFTIGALVFIRYMDAPVRKSFGVSGIDFIKHYIAQTIDGAPGMEEFFKKIGESVDVPVTVVSFKTKDHLKATFVIASVHPGPLGEIGGGNLPIRIVQNLDGGKVFVPHGTATHDFNLVSSKESSKIVETAKSAINDTSYHNFASRSIRVKEGDIKLLAQRFGNSLLFTSTLSPESTEDIEYGLGLLATAEARIFGAKYAALIDAHNCTAPYAHSISPGTKRSFDLINAVREASSRLVNSELGEIRLGVSSQEPMFLREEGMGDLGIQVAVIEVDGQQTAYVLIDANNMVEHLRDVIIQALKADEAEVMTTDNHVVNTRGTNLLGARIDSGRLLKVIMELVETAKEDLEQVSVGMNTKYAKGVSVFGSHKTAELASTVNAIMAMGGALGISVIIAAVTISLLLVIINS